MSTKTRSIQVLALAVVVATGLSACVTQPVSEKRAVEAGPIWNQADAEKKCPQIARQNNATWTGQWWTTVQGQMSVCEIQ